MSSLWQIVVSSTGGALVSLVGVFAGAVLTSQAQRQHWSREKQIEACTDVIREATRLHRALYRGWERGEAPDWVSWNQALSAIWLLGDLDLINAAARIDETFFRTSTRIRDGHDIKDLESWLPIRDAMEADRLNFINVARTRVLVNGTISTALVARTATAYPYRPGNEP